MGFSKEQVKDHIFGVESRVTNHEERKQYGYEFARLCYQVQEYSDALRYLSGYLSVNGRDHRAQKWMGRLYEAVEDFTKAIAHYKRSLDLKKGQKDVIESVATLYCKMDNPPVASVKNCLKQIQGISEGHPMVLRLSEKIQSLDGSSSMEDLIKRSLSVNSSNEGLHIRLVKVYFSSGKFVEAFKYCQDLRMKGEFIDSLQWQTCALDITESYYEQLRTSGCSDPVMVLESLVAVLDLISAVFRVVACPESDSLVTSAALLLKFDKVLCATVHQLRTLPITLTLFHVAVRELCGRIYMMAGQYLYFAAQQLRQSVLGMSDAESIFQLGDMSLLSSLKATPPDLEFDWSQPAMMRQQIQKWHSATSSRTSIAGHHLKMVASKKGQKYFSELPKHIGTKGGKLYLIKALFGGSNQDLSVKFGSQEITFSLQESFLAGDDSFLNPPLNLPSHQDLEVCDRACVVVNGKDLKNLLWLCLAHRAMELDPPVFSWLLAMFDGLKLDTPNISCSEPDTVCICDIEAYVTLLSSLYSRKLTTPPHQLYSVSQSPIPPLKLSAALAVHLPSSLSIVTKHLSLWSALIQFLGRKLSVRDAVAVKKLVREFLTFVRGSSPLQLNLEQLTLLARHFKERAEKMTEGATAGDRDTVSNLLRWSSHYWTIIVNVLTSDTIPASQAVVATSPSSPAPRDSKTLPLLTEARMALANEALFKQDTAKALRLYSRVKTPHAAWNQSQIYLHLANLRGKTNTPDKLDSRILNLQKALDNLELAIARLSPSGDASLQRKLLSQRDDVRNLLEEARKSPLACTLHYDESPLKPRRSSTPVRQNIEALLSKEAEHQDVSRSHIGSSELNGSLSKSMSQRDEQLSAMARQLEQIQAEMEMIKSQTMSGHRPSPGQHASSLGSIVRVHSPSSGLQPHPTGPFNHQNVNRSPMFSQLGPSLTVYGPSSTVYGPSPTAYGLSPTVYGPSPTTHGPSTTVYGPSPTTHGLSPTVYGPSPTTHGPSPTTYGPSPAEHETSQSNVQEAQISGSPFHDAVITTKRSEFTSPFPTNMPPNVSPVFRPLSSSLFAGSALPILPPLHLSPQNVPSPPKGLTLPPHLQSHAHLTQPNFVQPSSESMATLSKVSFPASTSSTLGVQPLLTLSSFPTLQPAISTTNTLFWPPTTVVTFQSSAPAIQAQLPSSTAVAPMFGSFTTVSVFSSSLPTVSTVHSSLQPTVNFGPQTQTKSVFNFTASSSFDFGQGNLPTPTTISESVSFPRKVLKVEKMPKSLSSGFVFQPSAVTKSCIAGSTPTTVTPAITSSSGILSSFSTPSSTFNVASSPAVTLASTQPLTLCTAQATTVSMDLSSQTRFHFQPSQPSSSSTALLSKTQDIDSSSHVSTQAKGLSSAFPMLSSLLSNKSASDTQPRSSLSADGSLSSTSAPSFVFSFQPVGTSSSASSIAPFTFSALPSSVNKVEEKDEPDAVVAEDQESPLDTSEGGPDFVPIVTLPKLDNIMSGEENENVLFEHRAKLYRFCNIEWKERGLGDIKILKHNTTGKVRLLMRREQILKVCCNHYLSPGMSLTYVKGSNRMLAWYTTADFADGEAQDEKLAIKFKNESIASEFKDVFENCVSTMTQMSDQIGGDYTDSEQDNSSTASEKSEPPSTDTPSQLVLPCSPGSWTCQVCLVSNNEEATQCAACTTVKPGVSTDIKPFSSPFFKAADNWSCEVCLLSNKQNSVKCIACSAMKPETCADSSSFSPAEPSTASLSLPSQFAPVVSNGSPLPLGGFKLASGALKAAATSTFLKKSEDSSGPIISASALALPFGGFKLPPGTLKSAASPAVASPIPSFGISELSSNTPSVSSESPATSSLVPPSVHSSFLHPSTFTTSDSKQESKPFVFDSKLPSTFDAFPSVIPFHKEDGDEIESTEQDYEPDVYFKPVVTLPDIVDVHTGEEGSEVLFSHRAKLYRFDKKFNQWKERGIGDIKILKNKENNKLRVVMRREQVKKLCCNHYLAPKMFLSPMANSDRAWIWYTLSDFADEVSTPEKFAVKFKLVETAERFKVVFVESVESLSLEGQCPHNIEHDSSDVTNIEDVIITHVEMPSAEKVKLAERFLLPITFFNYETKPPCPGCRGCVDQLEGQFNLDKSEATDNVTDSHHHSACGLSQEGSSKGSECVETETVASISHEDSAPKPFSGSFLSPASVSFSDLALGDGSFLFGSKSATTKSPGFARAGEVLFGSKVVATDTDENPESEVNIDFKPLVSLPEVELVTGEESDETLFSHRAKLYRFDSTLKQWKERGVGNIKIVKNAHTNKARVLMRRDQIRKVCCNHAILPDMSLTPNQGSDKSWVWYTPCDFCEEVAKPEKLAVRFKYPDKAAQFKEVFDMCKTFVPKESDQSSENFASQDIAEDEPTNNSQEINEESILPLNVGGDISQKFTPTPGSWSCSACLVVNTQASLKCVSCGTQHVSSQSIEVSPPSTVPDMDKVSSDSSSNRNPLVRFPLDMSPEVTRQPFVFGPPPVLNSPQVSDLENEVMPKLETLSKYEDDKHQCESDNADMENKDARPGDSHRTDVIKEDDGHRGGIDETVKDNGDIETRVTDGNPVKLTSDIAVESTPKWGDIGQTFAPDSWTCGACPVVNTQASLKCVSCGTQHVSSQSIEVSPPSTVPDMDKVSSDSSSNRNPLVRFPLDMSPEATRQPFVLGSPPALYSPQVCNDLENEVMPKLETLSKYEDDEHKCESDNADTENKDTRPGDSRRTDAIKEDDDHRGGIDETVKDNGNIETRVTDSNVVKVLTSDIAVESTPNLGDDSSEDEVIVLFEELPDDSLVLKAKELMLPPSFFMYQKKPPCRGCRGCTDDSSHSFVELLEESTNDNTVASPATDVHSLDEKSVEDITPEKPLSSDVTPPEESTSFFAKPGLLSFSDITPGAASGFAQSTPGFQFHGAGKQLFTVTTAEENDDPEIETDVNFKPIVSLPEVAPLKSWDDDAVQLFVSRAKLYRFDTTLNQWKERGVGDMKIFRHKETGRVRMIMRRDQIFKVCCNHYITAGMNLMPGSSEKSWVWLTHSDLSDDAPKSEKFAIRFRHVETAQKFKNIFEECVSQEPEANEPFTGELPKSAGFKPASGSWSCPVCLLVNKTTDKVCAACQAPNDVSTTQGEVQNIFEECVSQEPEANEPFTGELPKSAGFKPASDSWSCSVCLLVNKTTDKVCAACQAPNDVSTTQGEVQNIFEECVSQEPEANEPFTGELPKSAGFKPASDSWSCPVCLLVNKTTDKVCAACQAPNDVSTTQGEVQNIFEECVSQEPEANEPFTGELPKSAGFKPASDSWSCSVCLLVNKTTDKVCAACQAPNDVSTTQGEVKRDTKMIPSDSASEEEKNIQSQPLSLPSEATGGFNMHVIKFGTCSTSDLAGDDDAGDDNQVADAGGDRQIAGHAGDGKEVTEDS